jgi:hypothetical protein
LIPLASLAAMWMAYGKTDLRGAALCLGSLVGLVLFHEGYLHPSLMAYQPFEEMGSVVRREDPNGEALPFIDVSAFNAGAFYANRPAVELLLSDLPAFLATGKAKLGVIREEHLAALRAAGIDAQPLLTLPLYSTSTPKGDFLLARTRESTVARLSLVRLVR